MDSDAMESENNSSSFFVFCNINYIYFYSIFRCRFLLVFSFITYWEFFCTEKYYPCILDINQFGVWWFFTENLLPEYVNTSFWIPASSHDHYCHISEILLITLLISKNLLIYAQYSWESLMDPFTSISH